MSCVISVMTTQFFCSPVQTDVQTDTHAHAHRERHQQLSSEGTSPANRKMIQMKYENTRKLKTT